MIVNRTPSDLELLSDLFVGGTAGETSRNIKLSMGQMAASFTVKKPVQFGDIGFGAACRDGSMAVEGLF